MGRSPKPQQRLRGYSEALTLHLCNQCLREIFLLLKAIFRLLIYAGYVLILIFQSNEYKRPATAKLVAETCASWSWFDKP